MKTDNKVGDFERGYLVAVSTMIGGWGEGTQSEHMLREINATVEMVEALGLCDFDKNNLIPAIAALTGDDE